MLHLSRHNIEAIGESVLRDFTAQSGQGDHICVPIDIIALSNRYLGLEIQYRKLSDHGNTLGLTAYGGMEVELSLHGGKELVHAPEDTIFLDEKLRCPEYTRHRRFTIAHECAHQILARIAEIKTGYSFHRVFEPGKRYASGEIKTAEDWCEWQANALGAALLMPKSKITPHMNLGGKPHKLTLFGYRFNYTDYKKLKELSEMFKVSSSAMKIRLGELGFIVNKSTLEYADPLDIFVDAG